MIGKAKNAKEKYRRGGERKTAGSDNGILLKNRILVRTPTGGLLTDVINT